MEPKDELELAPSRGPRHGLSGQRLAVYAAFVALCGSLDKDAALALTADALKDSQEARLLEDYGGVFI
ncbi:uncharacterized protein AMSG_00085 [Thecamonas trahens ATCC 50062]|uniref:Uncharacterized protein n=1 Tax=Thecamonas trahens ATCC 50062 TaxID=461836 RepID=A0A0L0D0R6_THETB|nr:hypothetical protein AMSG_00085 [Thecamonas trahens ATCC 50062]KNC45969.1 hypothetical protein AMSG_00085 [Thecamonas trahens ATCC 50062]|eukprot:XP_013762950.1 hypothetical protein AMSG_00085 [Thecamonas trahens ATCC 50062]